MKMAILSKNVVRGPAGEPMTIKSTEQLKEIIKSQLREDLSGWIDTPNDENFYDRVREAMDKWLEDLKEEVETDVEVEKVEGDTIYFRVKMPNLAHLVNVDGEDDA